MMNTDIWQKNKIIAEYYSNRFFESISYAGNETIENLIKQNYLKKHKERVYINYNKKSNVFLKMLIDQENFERLSNNIQNEILNIKRAIIKENRNKIFGIFLIGSFARNTYEHESDFDFVIIHSGKEFKKPNLSNPIRKVQFISYSKNEYECIKKPEMLAWALKYGLILYDRNYIFYKIKLSPNMSFNKEYVVKKREQIEHLFNLFNLTLQKDNKKNIELFSLFEKVLHLISRYIIYLNEDFPLSRPELKNQMKKYSPLFSKYFEYLVNQDSNFDIKLYYSLKNDFKKVISH